MIEYDLSRSLKQLKLFIAHPAAAFRRMSVEPDMVGALFVLDALAFFSVVVAVVSGVVEPSLSWGFFLRFIVLYVMVLVLFILLVGFEAGVAVVGARLINVIYNREARYWAMYCVFGYAKLPLVIAALIYIFLPVRLDLTALINTESANVVMCAFVERAEVFEAMAFVLGALGVRVVGGVTFAQSVGIVFLGWLLGTPVFYCVMNAIIQ